MPYKKVKLNHISLKALEVGHIYKYPIFYKENDGIFVKLIEINESFTTHITETINQKQIKDVYVLTKDYQNYELDTQKYLALLIKKEDTPISLKFEIVQDLTAETMNNLFHGEVDTQMLKSVNVLLDDTIDMILHEKSAIKAMLDVTSYDYYTYTHCVNVSLYTLGFGAYLNIEKEKLLLLGKAALLHDLGKKDIPNEIVNKNGALTDEEFKIMQQHPSFSVNILKKMGETNHILLDTIEQHHEKLNGTGYPYGLKQAEINSFAQIVAIADIFDALTTKRSYKNALKTYEALDIMYNEMKDELNVTLLNEFITFMSEKTIKSIH